MNKEIIILQKEHPALRQKARPVPVGNIDTPEITQVLSDMREALSGQEDGVALAAPQIGVPYRIFIVSGKIFDDMREDEVVVFINPELINHSKKKEYVEEGCLSVRWQYGYVRRYRQATVKALDEKGGEFEIGASGLLAQIFQHEIDHLNGVLFTDKAKDLQELPPEQSSKNSKSQEPNSK